jgi:5'(3')-deoxyribonucleotidase
MQRVAIDMDDVLADATDRFFEYAQVRHGKTINPVDIHDGKTIAEASDIAHEEVRSWLYEDGFFRGMKVIADSQDVVKRLITKYEVFIVSAAVEFPQSMKEKVEWLEEYFPFIDWKYMVFCGHKYMIQADYLIDDHLKNLEAFKTGTPLMFTAHHNKRLNGYERMNSWKEIAERLGV